MFPIDVCSKKIDDAHKIARAVHRLSQREGFHETKGPKGSVEGSKKLSKSDSPVECTTQKNSKHTLLLVVASFTRVKSTFGTTSSLQIPVVSYGDTAAATSSQTGLMSHQVAHRMSGSGGVARRDEHEQLGDVFGHCVRTGPDAMPVTSDTASCFAMFVSL